jgi:hypothetical protein
LWARCKTPIIPYVLNALRALIKLAETLQDEAKLKAKRENTDLEKKQIAKHPLVISANMTYSAIKKYTNANNLLYTYPFLINLIEKWDSNSSPKGLIFSDGTLIQDNGIPSRVTPEICAWQTIPGEPPVSAKDNGKFKAFMELFLPDPEIRDYVIYSIARMIAGCPDKRWLYFVGEPDTSKTTLLRMLYTITGMAGWVKFDAYTTHKEDRENKDENFRTVKDRIDGINQADHWRDCYQF